MKPLTLITHVYNAQSGVNHHVNAWKRYAPDLLEQLSFIVIDDFSDPPIAIDKGVLDLRLFRVLDDIDWNMPGCRNLAAIHADTQWLLYFDVDDMTTEEGIKAIVAGLNTIDPSTLYVFPRWHDGVEVEQHINTFLIARRGYFKAGGYDEDFSGYYGFEDVMFRNLWRKHVGPDVMLVNVIFQQLPFSTKNLTRNTHRNNALIQYKAALGMNRAQSLVRFAWEEI